LTLGPVNLAAESGFWFITWQNMEAIPKVQPLAPERSPESRVRSFVATFLYIESKVVKAASKRGPGMSLPQSG
jgi:hypothetical protein